MTFSIDTTGLEADQIAVLESSAVKAALLASYQKQHEADEKPLRTKRDELMQEVATLKGKVKEVDDLGGVEALKKAKELEPALKGKDDAVTEKDMKIQQLTDKVEKMQQQQIDSALSKELSKAIREMNGIPELLEPALRARVKADLDESGRVKITVLGEDGKTPWVTDGRDATPKDLLSTLKSAPTYSRAFDAPKNSGGGSDPGGSRPITEANPFAKATLNVTEQSKLMNTDKARAVVLANAAGVKIQGLNA